jgi:transcriptional regulator with XRE-family HTH domain
MKTKQIIPQKSSEKVAAFLEKNGVHKRDFAEMIGVTLSYVYNLIDETVSFSTRGTTIERIAVVMEVEPEEFSEYKIPQEPVLIDETIEAIKDYIKENKMSVVSFLKSFPRKKRLDMVDMLRGALPLPIDFKELHLLGKTLNMPMDEIYSIWETRMKQVLESGGMNIYSNSALIDAMFECAKKQIMKSA